MDLPEGFIDPADGSTRPFELDYLLILREEPERLYIQRRTSDR